MLSSYQSRKTGRRTLHSCDTVLIVAGDVEPGAGIYKCWIPALKDIIWIYQLGLPNCENIPCSHTNNWTKSIQSTGWCLSDNSFKHSPWFLFLSPHFKLKAKRHAWLTTSSIYNDDTFRVAICNCNCKRKDNHKEGLRPHWRMMTCVSQSLWCISGRRVWYDLNLLCVCFVARTDYTFIMYIYTWLVLHVYGWDTVMRWRWLKPCKRSSRYSTSRLNSKSMVENVIFGLMFS